MVSIIKQAGYKSNEQYLLKVLLPIMFLGMALFFVTLMYLPVSKFIPYLLLFFIFIVGLVYPYLQVEKIKVDIHEKIHLFITYAGTISTLDIDRETFFRKVSEGGRYGQISYTMEHILYLARSWNLGFTSACRRIGKLTPSKLFGDFLDRLAAIMDFGVPLRTFLTDEQDSLLASYGAEYQRSLKNIGMLQEVFSALTIAFSFGLSSALLMPLLLGMQMTTIIKWSLFALVFIDVILVVFVNSFIPSDDLFHKLKDKNIAVRKMKRLFFLLLSICVGIMSVMSYYQFFSFLTRFAISMLPLLYVGYLSSQEDTRVMGRDKAYPSFIRALGSSILARQGSMSSSMKALRVHDFGVLNDIFSNLDRRLTIRSNQFKSWYYFSVESGSSLISSFTDIFADSVIGGGNAEKIGEIISRNFVKLLSLRSERLQLASGLRGTMYGSILGFTGTLFITISISDVLYSMFQDAFDSTTAGGAGSLATSIIPQIPPIDQSALAIYVALIIIVHSFISALIVKLVDGGHRWGLFQDFTIMVWIGTVLSWILPKTASLLFSGG